MNMTKENELWSQSRSVCLIETNQSVAISMTPLKTARLVREFSPRQMSSSIILTSVKRSIRLVRLSQQPHTTSTTSKQTKRNKMVTFTRRSSQWATWALLSSRSKSSTQQQRPSSQDTCSTSKRTFSRTSHPSVAHAGYQLSLKV